MCVKFSLRRPSDKQCSGPVGEGKNNQVDVLEADEDRAGGKAAPGDLQAHPPDASRHHLHGQLQHRLNRDSYIVSFKENEVDKEDPENCLKGQ